MSKEIENRIIKIFKDYSFYSKAIELDQKGLYGFNNEDKLLISNYQYNVLYIDNLLDSLSEDSREFLKKRFLYSKSSNWWMNYYSKSTYYRHKNKAYKEFIDGIIEDKVLSAYLQ